MDIPASAGAAVAAARPRAQAAAQNWRFVVFFMMIPPQARADYRPLSGSEWLDYRPARAARRSWRPWPTAAAAQNRCFVVFMTVPSLVRAAYHRLKGTEWFAPKPAKGRKPCLVLPGQPKGCHWWSSW